MNEVKPSVFTKIINGELPCHKVYEDDTTLAFLDIFAVIPGHTLVVPKRQVEFVWDLSDADYHALMETTRKVARRMREVLDGPYVGEKIIGTDVPHAHIHLIPFTQPSDMHRANQENAEPSQDELAAVATRLRFE